ncbi:MAG: helix-turn-helix domain-containing protein [Desulfarculaceae bacterium]|nr:helix-turn-helix domain-containing protein [Desulfarculaceae bacterium]
MASKNQHFGEKLKAWMDIQEMNAPQLADILGCSKTAAYQYKDGRVPEWNFLLKLSKVMGESIEDLLDPRVGTSIEEEGGRAWIRLPRGHPTLKSRERKLLEDVVDILVLDGPAGVYTKMIQQAVETGKHGVGTEKKIDGPCSEKKKEGRESQG